MQSNFSAELDDFSALAWHIAMGADEAIDVTPINRFKVAATIANTQNHAGQKPAPASAAPPLSNGPTPVAARPVASAMGAGAEAAKTAAQSATSLEELKLALEGFDGGALKRSAKNTVFAAGSPDSPLMVIGGAAGREEDASGIPFTGPAGLLLDKMLAAIGMGRENGAYLTHFVPWRSLGQSIPSPEIVEMIKPFIVRHIELAAPKVLMLLGSVPVKALYETSDSISRHRGKWREVTFGQHSVATIGVYSPDYLLDQPQQKAAAWQDLLSIKAKLAAS